MTDLTKPPRGSDAHAHHWWTVGASAEAHARDEDLTNAQREARDLFVGMCRMRTSRFNDEPVSETAATFTSILAAGTSWRHRAGLAWKVLR